MKQPAAKVTPDDVERLVRRDYGPARVEAARRLLGQYGDQPGEHEPHRVRAAILKLADGDLDALRRQLTAARRDYRDVLSAAEYPGYLRTPAAGLGEQQRRVILRADRRQYREWFTRE